MDNASARYFALALAASARVAGMQAENMARAHRGESMAYTDQDFFNEAASIEALAREIQ